jgi:hypothetical protein
VYRLFGYEKHSTCAECFFYAHLDSIALSYYGTGAPATIMSEMLVRVVAELPELKVNLFVPWTASLAGKVKDAESQNWLAEV